MERTKYTDIKQLIEDVQDLRPWNAKERPEELQRDYEGVLARIATIVSGYEIVDEKGETQSRKFPEEVLWAIIEVCNEKFPRHEDVFEKRKWFQFWKPKEVMKKGLPDFSRKTVLVHTLLDLSCLLEQTGIDKIAEGYKIKVHDTSFTQEEVDELVKSSQEYLKPKVQEMQVGLGYTVDEVLSILSKCRERGELVKINLGRHELYSFSTRDDAYKLVYGMPESEYKEKIRMQRKSDEEKAKEKKGEACEKIPQWVNAGSKLIDPGLYNMWKKFVYTAVYKDLNYGEEIDQAIMFMRKLKAGATEEEFLKEYNKLNNSENFNLKLRQIVALFSPTRGEEFYRATATEELTAREESWLHWLSKKKPEARAVETVRNEKNELQEEIKLANDNIASLSRQNNSNIQSKGGSTIDTN